MTQGEDDDRKGKAGARSVKKQHAEKIRKTAISDLIGQIGTFLPKDLNKSQNQVDILRGAIAFLERIGAEQAKRNEENAVMDSEISNLRSRVASLEKECSRLQMLVQNGMVGDSNSKTRPTAATLPIPTIPIEECCLNPPSSSQQPPPIFQQSTLVSNSQIDSQSDTDLLKPRGGVVLRPGDNLPAILIPETAGAAPPGGVVNNYMIFVNNHVGGRKKRSPWPARSALNPREIAPKLLPDPEDFGPILQSEIMPSGEATLKPIGDNTDPEKSEGQQAEAIFVQPLKEASVATTTATEPAKTPQKQPEESSSQQASVQLINSEPQEQFEEEARPEEPRSRPQPQQEELGVLPRPPGQDQAAGLEKGRQPGESHVRIEEIVNLVATRVSCSQATPDCEATPAISKSAAKRVDSARKKSTLAVSSLLSSRLEGMESFAEKPPTSAPLSMSTQAVSSVPNSSTIQTLASHTSVSTTSGSEKSAQVIPAYGPSPVPDQLSRPPRPSHQSKSCGKSNLIPETTTGASKTFSVDYLRNQSLPSVSAVVSKSKSSLGLPSTSSAIQKLSHFANSRPKSPVPTQRAKYHNKSASKDSSKSSKSSGGTRKSSGSTAKSQFSRSYGFSGSERSALKHGQAPSSSYPGPLVPTDDESQEVNLSDSIFELNSFSETQGYHHYSQYPGQGHYNQQNHQGWSPNISQPASQQHHAVTAQHPGTFWPANYAIGHGASTDSSYFYPSFAYDQSGVEKGGTSSGFSFQLTGPAASSAQSSSSSHKAPPSQPPVISHHFSSGGGGGSFDIANMLPEVGARSSRSGSGGGSQPKRARTSTDSSSQQAVSREASFEYDGGRGFKGYPPPPPTQHYYPAGSTHPFVPPPPSYSFPTPHVIPPPPPSQSPSRNAPCFQSPPQPSSNSFMPNFSLRQ